MDPKKYLDGTEEACLKYNTEEHELLLTSMAQAVVGRPFDIVSADRWINYLMSLTEGFQLATHLRLVLIFRNRQKISDDWTNYLFKLNSEFMPHFCKAMKQTTDRVNDVLCLTPPDVESLLNI